MKRILLIALLTLSVCVLLPAEIFRFFHEAGDQYRIVTTVDEDVIINGVFSHSADILNRIAVRVIEEESDSGRIEAVFLVSERTAGASTAYQWSSEYTSTFWRDPRGYYDISPEYLMPTVRNIPVFPERDLSPGDTWTGEAQEVHDFSKNFNIEEPLRFPVYVHYTYLDDKTIAGKELAAISIQYNVFHRTGYRMTGNVYDLTPVRISGMSEQLFYWDPDLGLPHSYSETFDIVLELASGDTVEYIGTAEGILYPAESMNRTRVADEIRKDLEDDGVDDVEVSEEDEGVTLRLNNIQFLPDSAELVPAEKRKLDTIASILCKYPDRDILVTGHTALAKTAELRQRLSELRARVVADYLIGTGCRTEERVITRGMGAREPVADNSTETGRRLNRRVEITILEN